MKIDEIATPSTGPSPAGRAHRISQLVLLMSGILIAVALAQTVLWAQPGAQPGDGPPVSPTAGRRWVEPISREAPVIGGLSARPSQQTTSILTVRHNLKGALTWLTVSHPSSWHVDELHVSGVRITSDAPETISASYGQPTTRTWGAAQIAISSEPGIELAQVEPGIMTTTTAVTVDGYPAMRYDFQDAEGRVDASVVVTLPVATRYVFDTQVAGSAVGASAMRSELDSILATVDFIPDYTGQLQWTRSLVPALSASGRGFDALHPLGWAVAATPAGGMVLTSPAVIDPPYTLGPLVIQVSPASASDAARWDTEQRLPYYLLMHEARTTSPAGLTTPLSFVPTSAYLVQTRNDAIWLAAVSNPAQTFGTPDYWLYDQTAYRVTTDSLITYQEPAYP